MGRTIVRGYEKLVLDHPKVALSLVLALTLFLGFYTHNFKLDASADSLVLENDRDLEYFRTMVKKYGSSEYHIITYTPHDDMMSERSLNGLRALKKELSKMPRVESIVSILDVPLIDSPKVRLSELADKLRTLETPDTDRQMALKEFRTSPIYSNLLMSPDGKTTAIQVNLKRDEKYFELLYKRNDLRLEKGQPGFGVKEQAELDKAVKDFKQYLAYLNDLQSKEVEQIRQIMDGQRDKADMFLGGVNMITSDMVDFIRYDLIVFGIGVICFLIIALGFFFKRFRWVLLPMTCCLLSAFAMLGYLGFMDWRVTVISSNFVSILLIITMSLTIHLIVHYGELYARHPDFDQRTLVQRTVRHMFGPCFYTALTTIVAFSSLVVSDIRPVIDFGWMMTIGIALAFTLSFFLFPSALMLVKPAPAVSSRDMTRAITEQISTYTQKHKSLIVGVCILLAILSAVGISKLRVDNRFIDYFKKSTEIYQGLEVIDKQLGGTTPLDIFIQPDQEFYKFLEEQKQAKDDDPFDDPFGDAFAEEEPEPENYWFHVDTLNKVEAIHDGLAAMEEIGKVQSIATAMKVVKHLNDGKMPEEYDLALIRKLIPEKVKKSLVYPYLSDDANQIRITMRIVEADPTMHRKALIEKIRKFLVEDMGIANDRIRFSGMAILYNNMLYSLYDSQIVTLGFVFFSILGMFVISFRNVYLALIAIVPNLLAASLVLGIMGWFGIPLDMMTITIAAITIGIAVDDTIHYIHRFKVEFARNPDYIETVNRCHGSIGRAIYYTSITVTIGFSILALSKFIPTIYFGLLTGFAMVVALMNNLTLLAAMLILLKPLGRPTADGSSGP